MRPRAPVAVMVTPGTGSPERLRTTPEIALPRFMAMRRPCTVAPSFTTIGTPGRPCARGAIAAYDPRWLLCLEHISAGGHIREHKPPIVIRGGRPAVDVVSCMQRHSRATHRPRRLCTVHHGAHDGRRTGGRAQTLTGQQLLGRTIAAPLDQPAASATVSRITRTRNVTISRSPCADRARAPHQRRVSPASRVGSASRRTSAASNPAVAATPPRPDSRLPADRRSEYAPSLPARTSLMPRAYALKSTHCRASAGNRSTAAVASGAPAAVRTLPLICAPRLLTVMTRSVSASFNSNGKSSSALATAGDALHKPAGRQRQRQSIPRSWRFHRSERGVRSDLGLGELTEQCAIDGLEIDEHPIDGQ